MHKTKCGLVIGAVICRTTAENTEDRWMPRHITTSKQVIWTKVTNRITHRCISNRADTRSIINTKKTRQRRWRTSIIHNWRQRGCSTSSAQAVLSCTPTPVDRIWTPQCRARTPRAGAWVAASQAQNICNKTRLQNKSSIYKLTCTQGSSRAHSHP